MNTKTAAVSGSASIPAVPNSEKKPAELQESDFESNCETQAKLLYSMIVAGKSANFTDKALKAFLAAVAVQCGTSHASLLPFERLAHLSIGGINDCLKTARTGNYGKLTRGISDILEAIADGSLDLMTCTPSRLEQFHGIGPKTSRFFIMWVRPDEEYAALDVHVLRWMRDRGWDAPKSTPQSTKKYRALEIAFIATAKAMGKTPRQLDEEIWAAGAGRTQESTTTANPNQPT